MLPDETPPAASPDALPARPAPRAIHWQSVGEVVLCSGYPSQLALGGLLQAAGLSPLTREGHLSAPFVFALSLADTAVLLTLIVWLLIKRGERPLAIFLGGRSLGREAAYGVATMPFIVALVVVSTIGIRAVAPGFRNVPDNPLEALLGSQTGLAAFVFVAIVAGGFREELQRAFLLHRFRCDLGGARIGLVVTSVAFGLGHTLQGWDAAIVTGLLGATWGAIYLSRGSAAAGIVSHSLFNCSELVRAFLKP